MSTPKKKANPLLKKPAVVAGSADTGANDNAADTSANVAEKPAKTAAKVAEVAAPTGNKIDAAMKSDKENTRAFLEKQEKVNFFVPLAQGEKPGTMEDVWINGYHTRVPKGVMTIIPRAVAEILGNKYNVETMAGSEFRLDLDADKAKNLDA